MSCDCFIVVICFQMVALNTTKAFFAPFFPLVAPELGLEPIDTGTIFAAMPLAEISFSPVSGNWCPLQPLAPQAAW